MPHVGPVSGDSGFIRIFWKIPYKFFKTAANREIPILLFCYNRLRKVVNSVKEILIAEKEVTGRAGTPHRFSYYRLEDAKGYGVCVKSGQGGTAVVPGITMRRSRIDALLGKLIRFAVSPVCARDVVEDWLAL